MQTPPDSSTSTTHPRSGIPGQPQPATDDGRSRLLRDRNFLWMLSGAVVSMVGDQFTLIALPWLVLKMTGDPLILGTVLALISVPRALFMLIGGALVDRHSPKRVLMLTKYVNTVLLGLLAALVLWGGLALWMVYLLAFGIGLSTAFSIPSGTAMLPSIVQPGQLQAANSIMLGLRQACMFLGPLLAGVLIALSGDGAPGSAEATRGTGVAFALDAFSFALSAWTLAKVVPFQNQTRTAPQAVFSAVAEGLRFFWRDNALRACFLYWGAIALLIHGPVQIALPLLATQLDLGAAAFGIMLGAHGAGTLAGMVVSGVKPRLRMGTLGLTLLLVDAAIGLLFIPMGQITTTWQGALLMGIIGLLGGFMQVAVFTWIQRRVPMAMLGRAMSLFMFIFMGLAPMSAALAGWLMRSITLGQLFAGSGMLLVGLVLVALATSRIRHLTDAEPATVARA